MAGRMNAARLNTRARGEDMAKATKKAAPKAAATGMTIDRSKYSYGREKHVGADGKLVSRTGNGDAVAQHLAHATVNGHTVDKIAKANSLEVKGANSGQIRMNLGNMLRARVKRGEHVVIGDIKVKALDQSLPASVVKAAEKAQKARESEAAKKSAAASGAVRATTGNRGTKSASRGKSSGRQTADSSTTSQTA